MSKPKYVVNINNVNGLSDQEKKGLKKVVDKYAFRANDYYLGLINWNDPKDPIRRLVVPTMDELDEWGELDASMEHKYSPAKGLEHKYRDTAILLVSDVCGAFCRYCFRKRIFMRENEEVTRDVTEGINYIKKHTEITNVLLTGGDPLVMATPKLEDIVRRIREIDHVKIIRIGTKMAAFNPYRIVEDDSLIDMIKKYSLPHKRIYVINHFNHPNEITEVAEKAIQKLHNAGAIMCNQTPMIAGINDNPEALAGLFKKLSFIGVPPYYVFQCRPTAGNKPYAVPIERGHQIFMEAFEKCSGLAKRARFAMSHATGKIEILATDKKSIYMRYHRAADPRDYKKFMVFKRNPEAYWLDDYSEYASVNKELQAART